VKEGHLVHPRGSSRRGVVTGAEDDDPGDAVVPDVVVGLLFNDPVGIGCWWIDPPVRVPRRHSGTPRLERLAQLVSATRADRSNIAVFDPDEGVLTLVKPELEDAHRLDHGVWALRDLEFPGRQAAKEEVGMEDRGDPLSNRAPPERSRAQDQPRGLG
jgi:hypothetical protein